MVAKKYLDYSDKLLGYYFDDITKNHSSISTEREIELSKLILETGDRTAINELVTANLKFAVTIAQEYQFSGLCLPDLINEANLGLIKAAEKYDYRKGVKFITYAVWWVRQSIIMSLYTKSRQVRLPINKILKISKDKKNMFLLNDGNDIDGLSGCNDIKIIGFGNATQHEDGDIENLYDNYSDDFNKLDENDSETLNKSYIKNITNTLTKKEKRVIDLYYGLDGNDNITLEMIGNELDLSSERIRQIKERAIRKIRNNLK